MTALAARSGASPAELAEGRRLAAFFEGRAAAADRDGLAEEHRVFGAVARRLFELDLHGDGARLRCFLAELGGVAS